MSGEELLTHFYHTWPYLNELFLSDIGVTLTDREKFLLAKPGRKLDLKITAGDPLKPGSAVYRAVHEKRRVVIRADKSLFGIPYIAVAIPLYDQTGAVVGSACVQESVERQDSLKEMSAKLNDNISVVAGTMEEIAAQIEEIAATCKISTKLAQDSYSQSQDTDNVLGLIKTITSQTNLLGLNAAIESARVGEQGRGFAVVAQEIRNLSTNSAESIKKIETVIKMIQDSRSKTSKQMDQIDGIIAQITSAITQVAGAIQQTGTLGQQLDRLADNLTAEDQD